MMNIAIVNIYGDVYSKDRLFDPAACKIGQNLLLPGILLKKKLEEEGHFLHTADMYDFEEIDVIIFQDLNKNSIRLLSSPIDYIKYYLKRKWKKDYLEKAIKSSKPLKKILIMQEPETVCPQSYDIRYHQYFDDILTWDDDLVDNKKYYKFQYPQIPAKISYNVPFKEKKLYTIIAGNKKGVGKNELYSKRYEMIKYLEQNKYNLDLYGYGWEKENFKSYRGPIDDKLGILSQYKYSICYENMCGKKGYITEKIFDCFFAGVVPIYWGAQNITDYVPKEAFIDRRKFQTIKELCQYVDEITEERYEEYLKAADEFITSETFQKEFSINAYIKRITDLIK